MTPTRLFALVCVAAALNYIAIAFWIWALLSMTKRNNRTVVLAVIIMPLNLFAAILNTVAATRQLH